jgi:hypothetical protein
MKQFFYINIPKKDLRPEKINSNTKLWYDTKSKKMIQVDGDLDFNYNFVDSSLNISGRKSNINNIDGDNKILDYLQREFDFDILNKSIFSNYIELIIDLFDNKSEFINTLDDYGLSYRYE